jgi:hypothetical protein
MRRFTAPLAFFACAAALTVSANARATAEFPVKMINDLGIKCPNPIWDGNGCTICHTTNTGGIGTATMPFGAYLKKNGLTAFNDVALNTLLTDLEAETPHTTDTNCDGKPDIDQLTSCDWQGLATKTVGCDAGAIQIIYGCSTSTVAPTSSAARDEPAVPAPFALGVCGALVVVVVRASSRRRSADRDRRSSPP